MPQGIELLTQGERIELLNTLPQVALLGLWEDPSSQQALERCLGDIIHAAQPTTLGNSGLELRGGAISN